MKLLVECSLKRTWRGNKIVKYILLLFHVEEWLTKMMDTYMGQFLQGGKNGRLMSFFSTAGALVVITV